MALLVVPRLALAEAPRAPLVLAAASLQESLNEGADRWAALGHPRPVLSFAATSALARQVLAGAPADLFIAADEQWMDVLARQGLLRPATRANLAGNRLVLIAPQSSPVRLAIRPGFPLLATLGAGRLAMADPDVVPAGTYGRQALSALGVWPAVAPRVVRAENVRAALALVARGEAALGVVYATDALAEPRVRVVGMFAGTTHAPIRYQLGVLASAKTPDAEAFRRFLLSGAMRGILRAHGFVAP